MFSIVPFRLREIENSHLWPDFFTDTLFDTSLTAFKADISESETAYSVEAELPGYTKDNITVEFRDSTLSITAKQAEVVSAEDKGNYLRKERHCGQAMRSFILEDVNSAGITAEFKDGVLKLNLPKKEVKEPEVHQIEIN